MTTNAKYYKTRNRPLSEGFELAKATLCLKGCQLYTDVWNDQPPLHTFIVTQVLKHISPSILGPRLVTTAFTMLLLSSVFFMSLRVSGLLVSALTTGLLIMSPGFLELSSSCMLEIPALALAIAALCLLQVLPPWKCGGSEVLAGAVFGAALMTKLVDLYLLPLAAVILWSRFGNKDSGANEVGMARCAVPAAERSVRRRNRTGNADTLGQSFRPLERGRGHRGAMSLPSHWFVHNLGCIARSLLIFIASAGIAVVGIDLLIEHGAFLVHFRQSWASHFGPTKTLVYGSASDHPFDWGVVLRNWDVTIPAALGASVFLSRFRRELAIALPPAWLGLSLLVFTIHKPWWAYYYVHNAIPLCWCAAGGFAWAIDRARARHFDTAPTRGRDWRAAPSPSPSVASGDPDSQSGLERGRGHRSSDKSRAGAMSLPSRATSSCARRSVAFIAALAVFGVGASCWAGARVYFQAREIRNSPQTYYALVLKEIERLKPWTEWIYADQQIYSFHTGIPIPPDLAVLVLKRFWAGEMDNDRITQELRQFKPGIILLANDARAVPFKDLLDDEYQVIYQDGAHRLYALKAMLKARKSALSHGGPEEADGGLE